MAAACRAAKKGGVSRAHAYQQRKDDPAFAAAWDEAIAEGLDLVEEQAFLRAQTMSDRLAIFLLRSHRPEIYDRDGHAKRAAGSDLPDLDISIHEDLGPDDGDADDDDAGDGGRDDG